MRSVAALVLTIGVFSALAGSPEAAKPGCNGLLAFSSNRAEDLLPQLYSISLDGKRTDLISNIGADANLEPSPDGSKLAYWNGSLFVADADGSHPRSMLLSGLRIANDGLVWSPDSRRIALAGVVYFKGVPGYEVAVFDADTGTMTSVFGGSSPHWSPEVR